MITTALPDSGDAVDPVEREALVPTHITTRTELAAWEQANVMKALAWVSRRPRRGTVLSSRFLRSLHRQMFDETWKHAGEYRRSKVSLGVPAWAIPARVQDTIARTRSWIGSRAYPRDEIAARYHHRLCAIRPFERGNGRVARLAADTLLTELRRPPFTWGARISADPGELSERYREALRAADNDNISPLLAFARG